MLRAIVQREFRLPRPYRPVLVQVEGAMAHLGVAREDVLGMIDTGELRWVWNVATAGERRELRFWLGDAGAPGELRDRTLRHLTWEEAIRRLVGREQLAELRSVTVADLLGVHRQQMFRLLRTGAVTGRTTGGVSWIHRASLVTFLATRWLGE